MTTPIDRRLGELRAEREAGEALLASLIHQENECRETLLRIAGAILVLEELAADPSFAGPTPSAPAAPVS
ncbi:hypothetical protein GCM10010168_27200 [Actinoplanes ianthinogenes]|uniref:Uncharacterized protein n=1 Tax=Actinoplanes ianthinogenes TaxID=122358 RepID=A0ABN6C2U7_9ACTN|nr:hypothetical protein [Actinoplanes ianthinogenes]BCJ39860.1 hypothetical protein Aiant_05170 [Actinoplanes ianthinogenes]GGR08640.1 hypothetical protein GCM10010168_27200 [Actinoplanes ianthinogenes]